MKKNLVHRLIPIHKRVGVFLERRIDLNVYFVLVLATNAVGYNVQKRPVRTGSASSKKRMKRRWNQV